MCGKFAYVPQTYKTVFWMGYVVVVMDVLGCPPHIDIVLWTVRVGALVLAPAGRSADVCPHCCARAKRAAMSEQVPRGGAQD